VVLTLSFCLALAGGSDLEDLASRYQFAWTEDAATGRHTLRTDRWTLAFVPGLPMAAVNGVPVHLALAPTIEAGRVRLPMELTREIEQNCLPAGVRPIPSLTDSGPLPRKDPASRPLEPRVERRLPPCTIAIDAGHGGIHTGYKGRTGLLEKDINLDVARELERILTSWGARVIMTRTDDSHFSADIDDDLMARVRRVNQAKPDLFLSVHTNGVASPAPRGFEVWVPLPQDRRGLASRDLATIIRQELGSVWESEDRGTKDEHNLRVLRQTDCPAALVELEFVSNPQAERLLSLHEHRCKLAMALAEAARRWLLKRR
jgi:N-acetylmuramoyl-L-alanine amidase